MDQSPLLPFLYHAFMDVYKLYLGTPPILQRYMVFICFYIEGLHATPGALGCEYRESVQFLYIAAHAHPAQAGFRGHCGALAVGELSSLDDRLLPHIAADLRMGWYAKQLIQQIGCFTAALVAVIAPLKTYLSHDGYQLPFILAQQPPIRLSLMVLGNLLIHLLQHGRNDMTQHSVA